MHAQPELTDTHSGETTHRKKEIKTKQTSHTQHATTALHRSVLVAGRPRLTAARFVVARRVLMSNPKGPPSTVAWGCDDTSEGTLFNGVGDARVNGLASQMQTDEQTDACIRSLEASRKRSREGALAKDTDAAGPSALTDAAAGSNSVEYGGNNDDATKPLQELMGPLRHFALADAGGGAPELKLYDAMLSPDRQLIKAGYFVAEGSLVVQQVLQMASRGSSSGASGTTAPDNAGYRLVSMLSTEAQLRKLAPDLRAANARYSREENERNEERAAGAATAPDAAGAVGTPQGANPDDADASTDVAPCVVFAGSRAHVSSATGFKHSALSVLAIARRPLEVQMPLSPWLSGLRAAPGTARPTLLVLDGVIKPENVGALFRTALAFGVCGVLLSPGCADPLYRKSIRSSMGGCFKLPYLHAQRWPAELDELSGKGYRLMALHLQGSIAHDTAIAAASGAGGGGGDGEAAPIAVMVGAEYEGVSDAAAERAHVRVRIPMSDVMEGSLDSLNVNVAAAIVLERVFAANRAA